MLEDVVGSFLDAVSEREFDAPLMALLRSHGFIEIHFVHGQYEFGKDVIAKRDGPTPTQYVFQSKAGDLGLPQWAGIRGQIDLLRTNELAHPNFDRTLPRRAVLVMTGRLIGGAPLEVQDYQRQIDERGETPLEVWDRERLIELMARSPEAGLAGVAEAPLLELIAHVDSHRVTDLELEHYARRWIEHDTPVGWRALLEAAVVAKRLAQSDRLDLACFTCLALLRSVWASVHGAEPPPDAALAQTELARAMFITFARDLWDACGEDELDPKKLISGDDEGVFLTYPVRCLRTAEIVGTYGLALDPDERREVALWLARFLKSQPGAAHPISDRWAVSLLPAALLAYQAEPAVVEQYLREIVRWLGDHHEGEALGLAPADADPQEEVDYLLGGALEHVERRRRRTSYVATVVLDLCAALELPEVYEVAYNDFDAVDVTPLLPLPNDDVGQYLVAGNGVDVPLNTSPKYAETWDQGNGWRMAAHHDDHLSRYYLGRIDRLWDSLTLSLVTRDRHWIAVARSMRIP